MSATKPTQASQAQALPPNYGRNFAIIGVIMGSSFGLLMVLFIMQNIGAI